VVDLGLEVMLRASTPISLDVSLTCARGQVLAIFGPSGSGKSTILRSIAGVYTPTEARVIVGGETWVDTSTAACVPVHQRAVGFVFQDYALFPHLTAVGNVVTALGHLPAASRRARAHELLDLVHLTQHRDRRPGDLSGGERQRVAVARALARDPAVLLLDEPFSAVDRSVRHRLQDEINQIRLALNIPVVLVTHDAEDVLRLATHVALLDAGRVMANDTVATVMTGSSVPGSWFRGSVLGSGVQGD
jgi:molybdate transport system ATP-binding protein